MDYFISNCTIEQCEKFIHNVNPNAPVGLAEIYDKYCKKYNIKLECVWAQMCLETNYLRYSENSIVKSDMNNYCGLGAEDGNGKRQACVFKTPEDGVKAHIQHLYGYCSNNPIPDGDTLVDPRFKYLKDMRGCSPTIQDLGNGEWASSKNYSEMLLELIYKIYSTKLDENVNYKGDGKKVDKKLKIAIRRGHQRTGHDGGAVGILNEVDTADAYSRAIIKKLRQLGHEVIDVTPPEANREVSDSLSYGMRNAELSHADLFISCHCNSFENTSLPRGCEAFANTPFAKNVAANILYELTKIGFGDINGNTRGVKEANYMEMRCKIPTIILEPFFIDSVSDVNTYNKVGFDGLANAVVKGLTGKTVTESFIKLDGGGYKDYGESGFPAVNLIIRDYSNNIKTIKAYVDYDKIESWVFNSNTEIPEIIKLTKNASKVVTVRGNGSTFSKDANYKITVKGFDENGSLVSSNMIVLKTTL